MFSCAMEALPSALCAVFPRQQDVPMGLRCPRFLKHLQQRGKHFIVLPLCLLRGEDEDVSWRLRDRNWVLAMEVMIPLGVGVSAGSRAQQGMWCPQGWGGSG